MRCAVLPRSEQRRYASATFCGRSDTVEPCSSRGLHRAVAQPKARRTVQIELGASDTTSASAFDSEPRVVSSVADECRRTRTSQIARQRHLNADLRL